MSAYSVKKLVKKLGIKPGYSVIAFNEPNDYWEWLALLPEKIEIKTNGKDFDFIHWFVKESKIFEEEFLDKKSMLKKDGMLWVSWPKRASKVTSDIDDNIIRNFALKNGLVDVKVCSVNEIWSGLKFVYRLTNR